MDARNLTAAQVAARCVAIDRLKHVADDMADFLDRIGRSGERPGTAHARIAQGPLALQARAGWMLAQVALIQAQAGITAPRIIDAIAQRDPAGATPSLRRLALSTLQAAEARLGHVWPAPLSREASR